MKQNLALILAILFTFCCFSQQDELQEYGIQLLSSENEYLNVLNSISLPQINSVENAISNQSNDVLIRQIGDYNRISSQTQSIYSDIDLFQLGNSNEIDLKINAPSINGKVFQNGNNNSVIDYIYYTNQDVHLNVIQNGDNLSVNRIGANSLSNKLQLVQQGSFKSITIISK